MKNKKPHNYKGGKPKCIDCGRKTRDYQSKRCSVCNYKYFSGENSPLWRNGISFEPYGIEFNKALKDFVRRRDNWKCQLCGAPQEEFTTKLMCHHIDYNKKDSNYKNLISLCKSCHTKTNHNRDYWTNYFQNKL